MDPKFAHSDLDPGYLTTRPGARAKLFYNAAVADPRVIALDEKTKDTVTTTYMATYFLEDVDADTARINVPVLIALGAGDGLMRVGAHGPAPRYQCDGRAAPAGWPRTGDASPVVHGGVSPGVAVRSREE